MSHSQLRIHLMGGVEVVRNGRPVPLPRSKKTKALLGYLIASGRPQRRSRLCSLLWDVTDDPRGALRWSLSKIRAAVDDADAHRIVADGESVRFEAQGAQVDVSALKEHAAGGFRDMATEALGDLANGFAGEFLEAVDLPDFHEYQAWLVAERDSLRRLQVRALGEILVRLVDDPERAIPFARLLVRYRPEDPHARGQLLGLLLGTERRREAEEQYRAGLDSLRDAGVPDDPLRQAWNAAQRPARAQPAASELRQEIRFCLARDGARIAYATCGRGPLLIKAANWLSHLEYDWQSPVWRHVLEELASRNTYVRYDDRGCGLSQSHDAEISFDDLVSDLEAVVNAVGERRFTLLGISRGAAAAIEYAVRFPERVRGLILYGGFATGWEKRDSQAGVERSRAILTLIRTGWGAENPAFRQIFTSMFLPGGDLEQVRWFNELQRVSATPEQAARLSEASGRIDVRDRLGLVKVPTLVMHAVDDARVPYACGQELAMHIPNARFVSLEGENHLILETDPGWPRFVGEIRRFLDETAE